MKLKDRQYYNTFLGSSNRVSVSKEANDKCSIKNCKKWKVSMVFVDDGNPRLSRYFGSFCRKHLYLAINKGWDSNDKHWRKKKNENNKK